MVAFGTKNFQYQPKPGDRVQLTCGHNTRMDDDRRSYGGLSEGAEGTVMREAWAGICRVDFDGAGNRGHALFSWRLSPLEEGPW